MSFVRRHIRVVVGLGAAGAALSLLLLLSRPSVPVLHGPGEGPLTAPGDAWAMGLDPAYLDRWTLGIFVCASDATSGPVLDSIRPVRTVGSFGFLGASLRRFTPSDAHPPIISLNGYPPNVPDTLIPAEGYRVGDGCSPEDEFAGYNELVLGIEKQGESGGGWLGEEVSYHVGENHYVLGLDYVVMVCGPLVPAGYC
jgi:hypothetical protein